MNHYKFIIVALFLLFSLVLSQAQSTETVPLTLNEITPTNISAGQENIITIMGTGFDTGTSISISTLGTMPNTLFDSTTLTISLPSTLAAGTYTLSATNSDGAIAPNSAVLIVEALIPNPIILSVEPNRLTQGLEATISILGSGLTPDLVVRLEGFGLLTTTFVNSGALTALVPANIQARENPYTLELIDGQGRFYPTSFNVRLVAPVQATQELSPSEIPVPTDLPQAIQTTPFLQVTSFNLTPSSIDAGQALVLNFTVTNRGNEIAKMITISLASGSAFVPAMGQVQVALADLGAGASATGQMSIVSSLDIAAGSALIPLAISYQNPFGESYSADAELSVTVNPSPNSSQLVVDAYVLEPSPAEAGQQVSLRLTLFNVGDSTASQVLLRLGGEGGVLLPNGRGDSVPMGDIEGRQRIPVELSLLVNTSAESGYQTQSMSISYFQNGEAHETSSMITVNIGGNSSPQPLLLLNSYDTGLNPLHPSSRFTLNIGIENAGTADAVNTLISFGTLQSSDGTSGETGISSMTPSASFAPIGTAGLVFVGDILSGTTIEASQEFMVSSSLASGIYPLPISLQYTLEDGTSRQDTLSISLLVVVPPALQINPPNPLPEILYIGEDTSIMLDIRNNGRDVTLLEAVFTIENGEIIQGTSIPLEVLRAGEDLSISAYIMALEEGTVELTLTLHYMDELNQLQSMVTNYHADALSPEPVEDYPVFEPSPYEEIPEADVNWFGKIMMALFGLGS